MKKKLILIITIIILSIAVIANVFATYFISKYKGVKQQEQNVSAVEVINNVQYKGYTNGKLTVRKDSDSKEKVVYQFDSSVTAITVNASDKNIIVGIDNSTVAILNEFYEIITTFKTVFSPKQISTEDNVISVYSMLNPTRSTIEVFDKSGKQLYKEKRTMRICSQLLLNGNLFMLDMGSNLVKLDFKTGEILARYSLINPPVGMEIFNGSIVACDDANNVYNLDNQLQAKVYTVPITISSMCINNANVFIASNSGEVVCLDHKFERNFSAKINNEDQLVGVSEKLICTVNYEGILYNYQKAGIENSNTLNITRIISIIVAIISFLLLFILIVGKIKKKKSKDNDTRKLTNLQKILKSKWSYIFLLPTIVLMLVICYYPAISGFVIAFFDYQPGSYMRFVGLDNFIKAINNPYFVGSTGNMVIFLITDLLKALVCSIIIAELIFAMRSKRAQYWSRVALYLPAMLPGVAGLLIWTNGILSQDGLVNQFLAQIGLPALQHTWLGDPSTAMGALIAIGFPWVGSYIIVYGALNAIPVSLIESSKLDGCSWLKRIIKIDIPLISPQLKYIFVTSFIGSIQDFSRVYLVTMGGPGHATYTPMLEMYMNLTNYGNYGEAAAIGLILFVLIFIITLFNLKIKTESIF